MTKAWILLCAAGALEAVWTVLLKRSEGFTKPGPSIVALLVVGVGLYCLSLALQKIPLAACYSVFIGTGAVTVTLVGILYFGEQMTIFRAICMSAIVLGAIGLRSVTT